MFKFIENEKDVSIAGVKNKLNFSKLETKKNTCIICDTRQKKNKLNKAIRKGIEDNGCRTVSSKLYIGDYGRVDTMNVLVDTKRGLGEIVRNLCSEDRVRFKRECLRAKELGIELIVLIIVDDITCIDDVHDWVNMRGQIQGPQLAKTMATWEDRYVHFEFCRHEDASAKILELLGVKTAMPVNTDSV